MTLDTTLPSNDYRVIVTGDATESFSVTSKSSTGFTITSSNSSSSAGADWLLIR